MVTADGNLQELVKTEVAGATLRISAEGVPMFKMIPWLIARTPRIPNLQIDVYIPELRNVYAGGIGEIDGISEAGGIGAIGIMDELEMDEMGEMGEMHEMGLRRSGVVTIEAGSAPSLGLRVAGGGSIRAESYEARDVIRAEGFNTPPLGLNLTHKISMTFLAPVLTSCCDAIAASTGLQCRFSLWILRSSRRMTHLKGLQCGLFRCGLPTGKLWVKFSPWGG